jgi:hypothetical protein
MNTEKEPPVFRYIPTREASEQEKEYGQKQLRHLELQ